MRINIGDKAALWPFGREALEQEFVVHKVWEVPDRAAALPVAANVRSGAITNATSELSADMIDALPNLD